MAAAALNYNRTAWQRTEEDPSYYYPVYDSDGKLHRGKFVTSRMNNWVPDELKELHRDFTFEGLAPCSATTPLGQALACPITTEQCNDFDGDGATDRCDIVYTGHNVIGR